MGKTVEALNVYLREVLGIQCEIVPWKKIDDFPFFLVDLYKFYKTSLLNQSCLLIVANKGTKTTPSVLKKHLNQIQNKSNRICIFVQETSTFYNRKRFIEHRIPFIIPGNQMYLPEIGIDLREHFRKVRSIKKIFSPSTQTVVIYALLNQQNGALNPSELSIKLRYSPMTMGRALDELELSGIADVIRKGRERQLRFKESGRKLWEMARPFMRDPVKTRIWAKGKKPNIQAGMSAVEKRSMLDSPLIPVYAVTFEKLKEMEIEKLVDQEGADFELEIWSYDPSLFAQKEVVDPFSLHLSLQKTEDERIAGALEVIMESIKW